MNDLISYDDWKKQTYHRIYRRSDELKAIDAAIDQYHKRKVLRAKSEFLSEEFKEELRQLDLANVDKAFGQWRTSKGLDYLSSSRNSEGAVTALEQQLRKVRVMTQSEMAAYKAVDDLRNGSIQQIFGGTKLEWKSMVTKQRLDLATVGGSGLAIAHSARTLSQISSGSTNTALAPARHAALSAATRALPGDLLRGAFGVDSLSQLGHVIAQIIGDWLKDFVAAITPWIGIAASGTKAVIYTGLAAKDRWANHTLVEQRTFMRSGDPALAADAMKRLISRNMAMNGRAAARSGAELGGKLASAFVDGGAAIGPAVGAASSIAQLIDTFYMIGRDWQEKKKVNLLLDTDDRLNADIFATCPLLGAYYLSTASDYEIMMLLVDDFGRANWMDKVEQVKKKHIEPLQKLASSYVFNSRFGLVDSSGELLRYKGTVPQGGLDKLKKKMGLNK